MDEAAEDVEILRKASQQRAVDWPANVKKLIFCDHDLQLKPIVTWAPPEYKEYMLPFRPSVSSQSTCTIH